MNVNSEIKNTPTFQRLDVVQRDVTCSKTNRTVIQRGFNAAKTMGFAAWEKMSGYSDRNKAIIKDLLTAKR